MTMGSDKLYIFEEDRGASSGGGDLLPTTTTGDGASVLAAPTSIVARKMRPVEHDGLLQVAWRRRWIVASVMLLCVGAAVLYFVVATPVYMSSAQLFIERAAPPLMNDRPVVEGNEGYLHTQCSVISSSVILGKALESEDLRKLPSFTDTTDPQGVLRGMLTTEVGRKDGIVHVMVESPYPDDAAKLANAIVDSYTQYQSERRQTMATELLKVLEKRKEAAEAELAQKIDAVVKFKQQNGALALTTSDGNVLVSRLAKLSDEMTNAEMMTINAQVDHAAAPSLALRNRLAAAQEREKEIREKYAAQMRDVADLNDSSANFMRLEAELKRSETLIGLLDSRAKELRLEKEAAPALNVQVLEKAWPGKKPVWPDKLTILAASMLLGVMLGVGSAKAYDVTSSSRLATPDQVRDLWNLPVLSHVPAVDRRSHSGPAGAAPSLREAFCVLRTAVLFGFRQEKVLLVTSPLPGDGKSTVATGLAVALANASHRTLLVDCDLRRPSIHRVFKVPNDMGLTTALPSPETAESAILPTSTPLLDVMPSGPIPPNPAELLNSRGFTDLLQRLARHYDRIILDSAPVLAAADSRIISALGAATLLVVRCGNTRVRTVERACESLRSVGGNVVGLVLNRVPRSSDEYYDYGGYTAVQYRLYDPDAQHSANGNGNGQAKVHVNLPGSAGKAGK